MSSQRLKRIEKHLKEIEKEEENDTLEEKGIISAGPIDESDMFKWMLIIKGPKDTPYESGIFKIEIEFPKDYPFKPPSIHFITKIFHMNIHSDGEICRHSFNFIKSCWSTDIFLIEIITEIINLLKFPVFDGCKLLGYPQDLVDKCFDNYWNREYYNAIAKEWTEKYAYLEYYESYGYGEKITEYEEEIEELINNFGNELDKVNDFYVKLIEVIEENKIKINKEKNELKQLKQKLIDLSGDVYYTSNRRKLKDLRDDLIKKDKEISELNLYIPIPIKEKLMTVTIISNDEKIHFTTTCHKKDYLSKIKELLYEQYPEYKDSDNLFYLKNKIVEENKNLENNGVKDNDIILLKNS